MRTYLIFKYLQMDRFLTTPSDWSRFQKEIIGQHIKG